MSNWVNKYIVEYNYRILSIGYVGHLIYTFDSLEQVEKFLLMIREQERKPFPKILKAFPNSDLKNVIAYATMTPYHYECIERIDITYIDDGIEKNIIVEDTEDNGFRFSYKESED